jgi:endoglucanase
MISIYIIFLLVIPFVKSISFSSESGTVKINQRRYNIKGISWFGFDLPNKGCIEGLDVMSIEDHLISLENMGFNSLRIPITPATLTNTPQYDINFSLNPDLIGRNSLEVLDKLVIAAANRGITVMLDIHSVPGSTTNTSLWYSDTFTEKQFISTWTDIIKRYINNWNVFAIDVFNEPHPIDFPTWSLAASRLGDELIRVNPKLLLFMACGSKDPINNIRNSFWGTNCVGADQSPIVLNSTGGDRIVYSPHIYGPSVYKQDYFNKINFTDDLYGLWLNDFGFLKYKGIGTVVIGEFGSLLEGSNILAWWETLIDYMVDNGNTDFYFWCYNPTTTDTTSIVQGDWKTVNQEQLNFINEINKQGTVITTGDIID